VFTGIPYWVYAVVLSAIFGGTAAVGFTLIRRLARWTLIPIVVLFIVATVYAVVSNPKVNVLAGSMPVIDNAVPFALAIGLVVTNWIMGCTTTPDVLRYGKNIRTVAISQFVTFGIVFGVLNWIGVPFAIATGSPDIMQKLVTLGNAGWTAIALFVIVFATWTTADMQCWIASLGLTYAIGKANLRWVVALIITAIGFVMTLYIWNYIFIWVDFIGTFLPPISAMILVEYFATRKQRLPAGVPPVNIAAYIAWGIGAILGFYTGVTLKLGIGAINSFIIAGIVYFILRLLMPPKEQPVTGEVKPTKT
jgi:cytosine permease